VFLNWLEGCGRGGGRWYSSLVCTESIPVALRSGSVNAMAYVQVSACCTHAAILLLSLALGVAIAASMTIANAIAADAATAAHAVASATDAATSAAAAATAVAVTGAPQQFTAPFSATEFARSAPSYAATAFPSAHIFTYICKCL
jgi:hypothetical protein